MRNKRWFALAYRLIAFLVSIVGVVAAFRLGDGGYISTQVLFFTIQSNLLTIILFAFLLCRTAIDLRKGGRDGSCQYIPRLHACILHAMIIVAVVFWAAIAPVLPDREVLWTFANFGTHLISPLLLLGDYILFYPGGSLTKRDAHFFMIFPGAYFVLTTILGFAGVEFLSPYHDGVYNFPYPFMDWGRFGGWTALMLIAVAGVILCFGYLLVWVDKRRGRENCDILVRDR